MRLFRFGITIIFAAAVLPASAARLTVLGDSLTKEYELSFPGLAGLVTGIDPANPQARNWAEILNARRNAFCDLGTYRNSIFSPWTDMRLLGHEYNWAIPGAPARTVRNLLVDPNGAELAADTSFGTFAAYAPDWKLTGSRLASQLATTSGGAVIWFGGNDLRFGNTDPAASFGGTAITYQTIYQGDGTGAGNPQPLMDSIKASVMAISQFVKNANPALPVAVCAVPHVGCAPEVKAKWPTDPVRTGRITAALDALNASLKLWTENTLGGAWVDVYSQTRALVDGGLNLGGVTFINDSDTLTASDPVSAHNRFVFSHDGFHPTSTMQGRVAQQVLAALRIKSPATFSAATPITDRELVVDILGIQASTGFDEFMAATGVPAVQRTAGADPDSDGLTNIVEFALAGNDPGNPSMSLPLPARTPGFQTLTWSPRFPSNIYAAITCRQSADLINWTNVPAAQITANPDGSFNARVPDPGPHFLRVDVTVTP